MENISKSKEPEIGMANKNADANKETISSYESSREEYIRKASARFEPVNSWLRSAVNGLDASARIFEFGSGPGNGARYLQSLDYEVEVSDAAATFVDFLNSKGFKARRFDVLEDELPAGCALIFADKVMQHFTIEQFETVTGKVFRALPPGGRFAFFTAGGEGEEWRKNKAGRSFYWRFWSPEALRQKLAETGFRQIDISKHLDYFRTVWLAVIVQKPQ